MSSIVLKITSGDTVSSGDIAITLTENGTAIALDGCSVEWETRPKNGTTKTTSTMAVLGVGIVSPVYTSAQTSLMSGDYLAQIKVTSAAGAVRRWPGPDQGPILFSVAGSI